MADFPEIRDRRPEPESPSDDVVLRARERLMKTIEQDQILSSPAPGPIGGRRPYRTRRVIAGIGAACAAAAALTFVVGHDGPAPRPHPAVVAATPQAEFQHAATLVAATEQDGTGSIRHQRFINLTDAGRPTYDVYVRPDGTALVGHAAGRLEESDGYLTQAQIASLPADPVKLRAQMLILAKQLGMGFPGERPERGLYRLATELLPDPGVAPAVKAGIYRVLAGFDLAAIRARSLGKGTDPVGRPGVVIEFTFDEGYVDRLVLDPRTGALLSTETLDRDKRPVGGQIYQSAEMVAQMPQASA